MQTTPYNRPGVALALVLAAVSFAAPKAAHAELPPQEVAARLVGASHGPLSPLSGPEIARLRALVKNNPAPYIAPLTAHIDAAKIASDDEAARQAANAAAVLMADTAEPGRAALAMRLADVQQAGDTARAQIVVRTKATGNLRHPEVVKVARENSRLLTVESAIIGDFAAAGDARLRDRLLDRIGAQDLTRQLSYLDYFERVVPNDPSVKQKLKPLLVSPTSPLHNSPRLKKFLDQGATK